MILFNKFRVRGRTLARINRFCWNRSPAFIRQSRFGMLWGRFILKLVRLNGDGQLTTTYFFRNRAELQLMQEIFNRNYTGALVKMTVVGCSEGAEVFSIIHTLKTLDATIDLEVSAFDIDECALKVAKSGRFFADSRVLSTMSAEERRDMFDSDGEFVQLKDQYRNVNWYLQDPTREPVVSKHPKQDIVVANRLLFHMDRKEQYRALKAIASLVKPGGYLFVSGVDLDVRTRIVRELSLSPITDRIEDIHAGDETMTLDWPFQRWGLEPLCKHERNWQTRYCSVFQVPKS